MIILFQDIERKMHFNIHDLNKNKQRLPELDLSSDKKNECGLKG